ncbi:methyltransferase [Segniliparus rotundus DSM 44985]|uniref:S-adenosyl-L-methionine-dependent methyltransferase n=1 Tax=Segniliparus rotundus (strain ATCC BAA-972 / CDC 1076 / CIP 108378 / DSM 44985 / JCM 13578) TaxID=640132 RepID=D6ZD65_SEGRD|nr:SAM-dependent methyltransferase [Segniliparus rotundus]ADG99252.1 methyltransferase [Segniliparus rotundus DSM 44985]
MARTDNDSWSIAESVGATAVMVAAARAIATKAENPIITDQFAEPLVQAVGVDFWSKFAAGEITVGEEDEKQFGSPSVMANSMAVRTKFFDEFFMAAGAAGALQAVILASGLDSRAYRLSWPDGTTVYELDQPQVIEFKTTTLSRLGATPATTRVAIPVDLRHDWPKTLVDHGFDPSKPSAWSVEGLTPYLPGESERLLYERIDALSPQGSWAAVEYIKNIHELDTSQYTHAAQRFKELGLDLDMDNLFYREPGRSDAAEWFAEHNWATETVTTDDLLNASGLPRPEQRQFNNATYLTSRK